MSAIDVECAFCGLLLLNSGRKVYCEECQLEHPACATCADDVTADEGYRLVA